MITPIVLLHNLEPYTEGLLHLVPVGAQHYELANLSSRTDMLAYTRTHVVVAYAYESDLLGCVFGQTVDLHVSRDVVAVDYLVRGGLRQ